MFVALPGSELLLSSGITPAPPCRYPWTTYLLTFVQALAAELDFNVTFGPTLGCLAG